MLGKRKRDYEDGVRERARELRRAGLTYTEIGETLGVDIPKSTINGWVKDIQLTPEEKERIKQKERDSILQSQPLAVEWNREQKRRRQDSGGRKREGYSGVCIIIYHSLNVRRMLDAVGYAVIDGLLGDATD